MNSRRHTNQTSAKAPTAAQLGALHSIFALYLSSGFVSHHTQTPIERAAAHRSAANEKGAVTSINRALPVSGRAQRLEWASGMVGRPLSSFSSLRADEAARLIDLMKTALGQKIRPTRPRPRRPDREQAHAYGTAGRRSNPSNEIRIVDAATLEFIDDLLAQLGWTRSRLDAFLGSSRSPVRSGAIRTLPDANRIIWALKSMLRKSRKQNSSTKEKDKKQDSQSRDENQGTGWLF